MDDFFKLYAELTADQVRHRLDQLAAEERALRVLLRSKAALEREADKRRAEKIVEKGAFVTNQRRGGGQ